MRPKVTPEEVRQDAEGLLKSLREVGPAKWSEWHDKPAMKLLLASGQAEVFDTSPGRKAIRLVPNYAN